MFVLFVSLYYSLLNGTWVSFHATDIPKLIKGVIDPFGTFITSIFGDFQVMDLGTSLSTGFAGWNGSTIYYYYGSIALVLATITSIGIVVMAVKGIKRVFSIFFMGIR